DRWESLLLGPEDRCGSDRPDDPDGDRRDVPDRRFAISRDGGPPRYLVPLRPELQRRAGGHAGLLARPVGLLRGREAVSRPQPDARWQGHRAGGYDRRCRWGYLLDFR